MKKVTNLRRFVCALALPAAFACSAAHAQTPTTVWSDNFSDNTLNNNLSTSNSDYGSVTEASNQLTMNSGENTSGARAGVYTKTNQDGTLSEFNEAKLYDFYDHKVTASFNIASVTPPATASGRPQFFFSIGEDANNQYTATQMDLGVSFGIELVAKGDPDPDIWRLFYTERGSSADVGTVANFSELPTGITFELYGNTATIDITGATFGTTGNQGVSVDDDTVTVTMSNTLGTFNDYTLAFGAHNRTVLDTGVETKVILNSFEVSVALPVPEPSSYALICGCLALTSVMLRRRVS